MNGIEAANLQYAPEQTLLGINAENEAQRRWANKYQSEPSDCLAVVWYMYRQNEIHEGKRKSVINQRNSEITQQFC